MFAKLATSCLPGSDCCRQCHSDLVYKWPDKIGCKVILNTGPVVGPHLQKAADSHAEPDASSITQQNVQNHLVPPALSKVRQQMHEKQL